MVSSVLNPTEPTLMRSRRGRDLGWSEVRFALMQEEHKYTFAAVCFPSVIDYCSYGNHSCDHECVSVLSGYHCRCNHGYRLLDNGRTCQGKLLHHSCHAPNAPVSLNRQSDVLTASRHRRELTASSMLQCVCVCVFSSH